MTGLTIIWSTIKSSFTWISDIKTAFHGFKEDAISLFEIMPEWLEGLIVGLISVMIVIAVMKTLRSLIPV